MTKKFNLNADIQHELTLIVSDLRLLSEDLGKRVGKLISDGLSNPLDSADAARLLTSVINSIRTGAIKQGDKKLSAKLSGDIEEIVERIMLIREGIASNQTIDENNKGSLKLVSRNGVEVSEVRPTPWFHGREVRMRQGYLRTKDIRLWKDNDRLEIQLQQFKQLNDREPTQDELRQIMLSQVTLPGVMELPRLSKEKKEDMFKIRELARSIAVNGVQRPPILDYDFTLIDGNRRVSACQHILESDEFDLAEKKRAEYIYVWQLTEERTQDDWNNVIVALNFEPPYKESWPPYIRIRRIYEAFKEMMLISPNVSDKGQLQIRKEIAAKFALDLETVTRYVKIARLVDEFEEYEINDKNKDEFEVKHRANQNINYFEELSKGTTPGTVQFELDRNQAFKNLVFDLVYDGAFDNFSQIRNLKYIYDNKDGLEILMKARDARDPEQAATYIDDAMTIARTAQVEKRELAANSTIERFIKFLEELPSKAFRDSISPENLKNLLKALKLVEPLVKELLGKNNASK